MRSRLLPLVVLLGCLLGAAGVALAAVAAHGSGEARFAASAAGIALAHAPALLALAALPETVLRRRGVCGLAIGLGALLFCADLSFRFFGADRFFPDAAPAGGMLMIAGWLAAAVGALTASLSHRKA